MESRSECSQNTKSGGAGAMLWMTCVFLNLKLGDCLTRYHHAKLYGLRLGWIFGRFIIFGRTKYFLYGLWIFNLSFLVCNRIYEGYRFSSFGEHWAYLDDFRGTFRWHICFNFVVLRMISFGHDYHWTDQYSGSDHKKHIQRCDHCSTGKTCYLVLQERRVTNDKLLSC
ncbi:uncharacterized protein LOC131003987 isoform X2 [Salvia miltiorrhiza]|uniref:uncharacterized protein LOC131003987 isoform X2 n=1 Tax=Salvia miltiorrhiza TaxID=226208 RepID=UPI0025ACB1B0|nr:uncharacterized protein LOC131003987 isoform X2 [Salvia miltiorrhiza]